MTDGEVSSVGDTGIFSFEGWNKITITRDESGIFDIYINDTLGTHLQLEDTTHTSGGVFCWSTVPGHSIDNVVVSDPEPPPLAIDPLLIGVGVAVVGVVVIAAVVCIRRR